MNIVSVLYGGALSSYALEKIAGTPAVTRAVSALAAIDGVRETVVLLDKNDHATEAALPSNVSVRREAWSTCSLLNALVSIADGYDAVVFGWADTPFLDATLANRILERHNRWAAEYSYADGWPAGIAPEVLSPAALAALVALNKGEQSPVVRNTLFTLLSRDINSFDIETELSDLDYRQYRLTLACDSKRNTLLCQRFAEKSVNNYHDIERVIRESPEVMRTLPAFFPIMVTSRCPHQCVFCPYSHADWRAAMPAGDMAPDAFDALMGKIADYAGDGVVDISLWGEVALSPERLSFIASVLARPTLSLIIETCGVGWSDADIAAITKRLSGLPNRSQPSPIAPLSWIVSLDSADPATYEHLHAGGVLADAAAFVHRLRDANAGDLYVQALRRNGAEDDIERFYRYWTDKGVKVIIQKYDHFARSLPDERAGDISPVIRLPCWHLCRDMPVLVDGSVVPCREDIAHGYPQRLGNALSNNLDAIWNAGTSLFQHHCDKRYDDLCEKCDEYYTYNF
jgi:spiro-SPASM protein